MSQFKAKLILFCGPSGSGKTTIVHDLLKNNPLLSFSVSATTRKRRQNEVDGVDYHFISVEEFKNKIANNEFIEWQEVYESGYYGTLKKEVERISAQGKYVIFDVDVEGGLNIKNIYHENLLSIFVKPPSIEELRRRLTARATETQEDLLKRVQKAEHELKYDIYFDHVLINTNLEASLISAHNLVNEFIALK